MAPHPYELTVADHRVLDRLRDAAADLADITAERDAALAVAVARTHIPAATVAEAARLGYATVARRRAALSRGGEQ